MHTSAGRTWLGSAVVGSIIGLLIASVVTYVTPKKYESEAVIEIRPVASAPADTSPQFFASQLEIIVSSGVLARVVDQLDLMNRWGQDKETAINILKHIVTPQNLRGTSLISVKVRHTGREDARDVAAEVIRAYHEYQSEVAGQYRDQAALELQKTIREQEEKVEVGGKNLADPEARRDFENARKLLDELKRQEIIDGVMARIPSSYSVIVHEEPQIPSMPVSPNVRLNMVWGIVAGAVFFSLIGGLFGEGRGSTQKVAFDE